MGAIPERPLHNDPLPVWQATQTLHKWRYNIELRIRCAEIARRNWSKVGYWLGVPGAVSASMFGTSFEEGWPRLLTLAFLLSLGLFIALFRFLKPFEECKLAKYEISEYGKWIRKLDREFVDLCNSEIDRRQVQAILQKLSGDLQRIEKDIQRYAQELGLMPRDFL